MAPQAVVLADDIIKLKMNDVKELKNIDNGISSIPVLLFVKFVDTLQDYPLHRRRAIRDSPSFHPLGTMPILLRAGRQHTFCAHL